MMKRRKFLRHTFHSMAATGLAGSFGTSLPINKVFASVMRNAIENDRILVMIYLEGGNDGLNTLVPLDKMSALNSVRPHVILPENRLIELPGYDLGLHPSLNGFSSLFQEGRLKIVQSVGYPEQNFSHFRSQDIWMTASGAKEVINSGWSGRYLDQQYPGFPEDFPNELMPDPLAIEIGYGSSLLFQGPNTSMSMVVNDPTSFYRLVDNIDDEPLETRVGDKLQYIQTIKKQSQVYGEVVRNAAEKVKNQQSFPQSGLGEQLKIVSRLIAGGLQTPVYLVRLGGFDTHDAQVLSNDHTKGEHSELLKELNDAVMAFMNDLESHGNADKVIGMTFSEFGRRIVSNASLGTDHGSAAPMFLFGNEIKGGVLGQNPEIRSNMSYEDNLPIQNDFRQVYASVLEQWFGLDGSQSSDLMYNSFDTVPVIGRVEKITGLEEKIDQSFRIYPNPLKPQSFIQFQSGGDNIIVELLDLNGKMVQKIYRGQTRNGINELSWNTDGLPSGPYLVVFKGDGFNKVMKVIK